MHFCEEHVKYKPAIYTKKRNSPDSLFSHSVNKLCCSALTGKYYLCSVQLPGIPEVQKFYRTIIDRPACEQKLRESIETLPTVLKEAVSVETWAKNTLDQFRHCIVSKVLRKHFNVDLEEPANSSKLLSDGNVPDSLGYNGISLRTLDGNRVYLYAWSTTENNWTRVSVAKETLIPEEALTNAQAAVAEHEDSEGEADELFGPL